MLLAGDRAGEALGHHLGVADHATSAACAARATSSRGSSTSGDRAPRAARPRAAGAGCARSARRTSSASPLRASSPRARARSRDGRAARAGSRAARARPPRSGRSPRAAPIRSPSWSSGWRGPGSIGAGEQPAGAVVDRELAAEGAADRVDQLVELRRGIRRASSIGTSSIPLTRLILAHRRRRRARREHRETPENRCLICAASCKSLSK